MKKSNLLLLAVLALLLCIPALACAYENNSTCPQAIKMEGRLDGVKDAPVYSEADKKSPVLFRMAKGDVCEVTGRFSGYYRIELNGDAGYISKSLLKTKCVPRESDLPETALSDVTMEDYLPTLVQAKEMPLKGEIVSAGPMDTVFFYIWDERQQRVEFSAAVGLKEAGDTAAIAPIRNSLKPGRLTAGRKTLLFQAGGENGLSVVPAHHPARGRQRRAHDIGLVAAAGGNQSGIPG